MVQFSRPEVNFRLGQDTVSFVENSPIKLELEDSIEEERGPLKKRSKMSSLLSNQVFSISCVYQLNNHKLDYYLFGNGAFGLSCIWIGNGIFKTYPLGEWRSSSTEFSIPPSQYNPLTEPSPLGLRLRKSPSLLDLIQMKLSQDNASSVVTTSTDGFRLGNRQGVKVSAASGSIDKLKASNFTASHLKIGDWEYASKHEGDLVAKCYFAKHKLVWEVLDGGLKSKIEIQWSDIMAMKANFPDDKPGNLTIVLARKPLFFRETNPQPRKHTLWQATEDFTDGQASTHRKHFLQCPQGFLNKHYEKLIQCDMRLNFLSQQPDIVLDSPYFASETSDFEDPDILKGHEFNQMENAKGSPILDIQNVASPSATKSSAFEIAQMGHRIKAPCHLSKEACSFNSGVIEVNEKREAYNFMEGPKNLEKLKVPGLRPSMSMSDLVNHIGNHISEQMTSGKASECKDILDNIAQILLSDTQTVTASDEKCLMSRVNSLCCLLQDSIADPKGHVARETHANVLDDFESSRSCDPTPAIKSEVDIMGHDNDLKNIPTSKPSMTMSRKDSYADLLLHLPRIESLPKFLFDISEDAGNHSG